jgi:hypothetical protein
MKIKSTQIAVRLIVFQLAQTPPIIAAGLLDQHTGSDLRPWRFQLGRVRSGRFLSPTNVPHQNRSI